MSVSRSRFVLLVALLGCIAAFLVALAVGSSSQADSGQPGVSAAAPEGDFEAPAFGTEVPELRTESSRTYRRADGRYQAQIWSSPVNYRDSDGSWKPIDTELRPDGSGGLETTDAKAEVSLPESLADPARVTAGDRWVSFALDGADDTVAPAADGATATYSDVLDGVDAEYEAQPLGVKETLTLADASAPSTYTYTLDASAGLTPQLRDGGAVAFRDSEDRIRFWLPAPTVQPFGAAAPTTEHVAYHLSEDKRTLTVEVDPEWLQQADFPVEVDPSIWYGDDMSCTLASATPTAQACGGTTLKVGHTTAGATYRAALRFPDMALAIPRTASVMWAEFALRFQSQTSSATTDTTVTVTGSAKTLGATATWNAYSGTTAWTTAGGDFVTDPQPGLTTLYPSYTAGWVTFNVSRLAERWLRSPSTNNGILVKAQTEAGLNNVLTFDGHQAAHGGPTIRVDYEWHPGFESDQTYRSIDFDGNSQLAVNVATGNVAVDSTDINLPGPGGFNLEIRRTFNGQNLGDGSGMFGSAWNEGINNAEYVNDRVWYDDSRTIYANGNAIYRFDRDPAHDTATTKAYLSPPNIDADLVADQSTDVATLTFRDTGIKWTYSPSWDGHHVALTQVSDAAGHHIDITPKAGVPEKIGSITDANGDVLTFVYGTNGQLLKITKGTTEWTYGTTIVNGHNLLTSYTSPSNQTTSYHYDASALPGTWDKLDKVTSRDNIIFNLVYGPQGDWSQVTQITQDFPDTRPDSIWTFQYHPDSAIGAACASTDAGRTIETNPAGQQTTYCYNTQAQVTSQGTTIAGTDATRVGDVDGDGTDDLVTVSTTGVIKVYPSEGAGFGTGTVWATWSGIDASSVALADADGDGDKDLVGRTSGSTDVRVAISSGSSFGTPVVWLAAAPAGALQTADVDGSGTDDLLIVQSTGTVQAAYAEGGVFDELSTWASLPSGSQPQLGDVTGDGLDDLVLFRAGRIEIRTSDANTFGTTQDWGATPAGDLIVKDADGDDTADLLIRNSSGTVSYLPSSGTAFGAVLETSVLPSSYTFGAGEVDGDGRADAVGRSGTQVSVRRGTAAYPVSDTTWAPDANTPEDPDGSGSSSLAAQAVSGSAGLSLAWSDDDLTSRTLQAEPDTEPDPAVRCSMPQLTAATDPASPQLALDRMRQTGATYIRINVYWSHYLDAPDKLAYRQGLRNAVFCAQRAGLTPYMTITSASFDSPNQYHDNPSPTGFASLVSAVVAEFYPLGVHRFSLWNEPNLATFLTAGTCGKTPKDTSTLYRNLYSAGYSAARTASSQGATVYLGELSEISRAVKPSGCQTGDHRKLQSTLDFLKDVVDTSPHLVAHGVAWHAYQHRSSPRTNSKGTGIYDIGRFQGVLSDMYHDGRLRTPSGNKPGLYITEFGYWNVPFRSRVKTGGRSPVAWRESQRATWLASALNRAAQNGARLFTFWQLNEAYSSLAQVTAAAAAQNGDGLAFDTGVLGSSRLLEPNGQRPYGVGPKASPAWNNPQPRAAFCRVRQWAIDNGKSPIALASGC